MTYALKLLFFVYVAGGAAWLFLKPAFAGLLTPNQYKRAWISLFAVTAVSFLSLQPGIFILLLAVAAFVCARYLGPGNEGKVNAFLLFLMPLPPIYSVLGGVEGLNYVMLIDHSRALSLVLLTVPAVGLLFRQRKADEPSLRALDVAMVLIQLWSLLLMMPTANLTGLVRALATSFCDVLIPYYVITRTLRTPEQLRQAGAYLMLGCLLMASVACVELLMQRNLYAGLQWIYGLRWESTVDLRRGTLLRVDSAAPQPIVLGFCMVFGMGLWSWLRNEVPRSKTAHAIYLILVVALVATWSRGPWLGTGLLVIALVMQRWLSPKSFGVLAIVALIAVTVLKGMGGDDAIMAGLGALFGNTDSDLATIVYRRDLFDATVALIKQSPWTGVPNFERSLEAFRQGEGLIDIVNTYLAVAINAGVVGLVLFLVPYVLVLAGLLGARGGEQATTKNAASGFAAAFVALIVAMLFIIFTVSSIGVIPYLLGVLISFPAAWLMQRRASALVNAESAYEQRGSNPMTPGLVDNAGMLSR